MDYYEKGEERFGFVSSRIYSFGSSKAMKSFYSFIANDIKKYRPVLDFYYKKAYNIKYEI